MIDAVDDGRCDVGYVVERVQVVGQQIAAVAAVAADAAQAAQRAAIGYQQSAGAEAVVVVHDEQGVVFQHPRQRFDLLDELFPPPHDERSLLDDDEEEEDGDGDDAE
ncbi:hypothetical protein OUZ56_027636 [Daphnia magna]|uniref:Uncharacterized protein n=1 Tax=Daphnia magna TaxID=35525 RepID=A0ABR0B1Q8_9CRUS|nr:hypothetical protein OUZ56_027636 [Daphnia magna]